MNREQHKPNPEFVSRLEWQLQSQYRRQQRFGKDGASASPRWNAWLRTAALVLVSLALGVAGVKATQHFENSWRKELLLARAQASSDLAQARLQISREMLDRVMKQLQVGVVGRDEAGYAELEVRQAELEVERLELDLEEIQLSGNPPRHELSAPLAGGRDFVTERLQLDEQQVEERRRLVRQEFETVRKRVEVGVADDLQLAHAEQELKKQEIEADSIRRNLSLRKAFLQGEISGRQADLQEMLIQAQARQLSADATLDAVRKDLELIVRRHKIGLASQMDLRQVEFQAKVAETEAQLAEMEVELLQKELEK